MENEKEYPVTIFIERKDVTRLMKAVGMCAEGQVFCYQTQAKFSKKPNKALFDKLLDWENEEYATVGILREGKCQVREGIKCLSFGTQELWLLD